MTIEEEIEMINRGELPPLKKEPFNPAIVVHDGIIHDFGMSFFPNRAARKYREKHGLPPNA